MGWTYIGCYGTFLSIPVGSSHCPHYGLELPGEQKVFSTKKCSKVYQSLNYPENMACDGLVPLLLPHVLCCLIHAALHWIAVIMNHGCNIRNNQLVFSPQPQLVDTKTLFQASRIQPGKQS